MENISWAQITSLRVRVAHPGMDECGDLAGPKWGHIPGDIPGLKKMTLAAEGFRQGKKLHPELFVAAWNPGFATRSPTGSSPA